MSRTFSVKFICSACSTPVYKVTKNVNVDKQWCSPCNQGKNVSKTNTQTVNVSYSQLQKEQATITEPSYKPHVDFDPVLAAEKDILYYLRLLHRVEELLIENYKTPEACHFTKLWDKAKEELN